MTSPPRKALLAIHGAGGSVPIFRVQTAKLRAALRNAFDIVYAPAPFPAAPGPGVLPLFKDMGPFYSWFEETASTDGEAEETHARVAARVDAFNRPIEKVVRSWARENPGVPIVGVLAFSEGALVGALLAWQAQRGRIDWLPDLKVALLVCTYHRAEASRYMAVEEGAAEDVTLDVPTLHLHGKRDFALERARDIVQRHYRPEERDVLEFNGEHHFPTRPAEVQEAAARFRALCARAGV